MSEQLNVEDVLALVEKQAQWMREEGPADMREMLSFVRLIRTRFEQGIERDEILAALAPSDD